jgi:hypothetical protein
MSTATREKETLPHLMSHVHRTHPKQGTQHHVEPCATTPCSNTIRSTAQSLADKYPPAPTAAARAHQRPLASLR